MDLVSSFFTVNALASQTGKHGERGNRSTISKLNSGIGVTSDDDVYSYVKFSCYYPCSKQTKVDGPI